MTARDELRRKLASAVGKIIRKLDADGVQLPADLASYKTFRKRETIEQKLIRKVGAVQRAQLGHIMELLGDPPNIANLTSAFWEQASKELIAAIQPLLVEAQIEQAKEILDDNPAIGVDWGALNREAIETAQKYTYDLVKGINETSRELLRTSISNYFETEMTIGQLEDLLVNSFGPVRASMIATTEITNAASRGEAEVLHQIQEQGIEMEATFESNDDEKVCDICGPLDGRVADGFDDNGDPYWIHPESGERYGTPSLHVNCRCWWTIGFKEKE